jgi:hypothetical protein
MSKMNKKESFMSIFIKDQLQGSMDDTQLGHLSYRTMNPLKNDIDSASMQVRVSEARGIYVTVTLNKPNWGSSQICKDFSRRPKFGQQALINLSVEIHNYLKETMLTLFHTEILHEYIESLPKEYVYKIEDIALTKGYQTCYQDMTIEDVEKLKQLMKDNPQKVTEKA